MSRPPSKFYSGWDILLPANDEPIYPVKRLSMNRRERYRRGTALVVSVLAFVVTLSGTAHAAPVLTEENTSGPHGAPGGATAAAGANAAANPSPVGNVLTDGFAQRQRRSGARADHRRETHETRGPPESGAYFTAAASRGSSRNPTSRRTRTVQEQLKMEHATLLNEYRALKAEIVANLESGRNVAALTLTAIGALLAAVATVATVPSIVDKRRIPGVLFLTGVFFCVLAWVQLRYTLLALDMGEYLRNSLILELRRVLEEVGADGSRSFEKVMRWETGGKSLVDQWGYFVIPIAGANYGIPFIAAVVSFGASCLSWKRLRGMGFGFAALIFISVCLLVFSGIWGFRVELAR